MPGRRLPGGRWAVPVLGTLLFLAVLAIAVTITLPGDFLLSAIRPALRQRGVELDARDSRLCLPPGVRLTGVSLTSAGTPPVLLDEVAFTWEWTGLLRWLPSRLRIVRGDASAELRFSPAFWNPSRGTVSLTGVSSSDIPLPVFASSGAGFAIRQLDARWRRDGGKVGADGFATLRYLTVPVPTPDSPIREARLENVALTFAVREDAFRLSRIAGTYEGSRVDGTGEVSGLRSPGNAKVTLLLRVQNPYEGRVAAMFNMMAKNAKNATLRIVGTLAAPTGEFQFF